MMRLMISKHLLVCSILSSDLVCSRVDAPMCTMVDLEMFSTMEFFFMIRVYKGYWNKFSLVGQAATLGNFFNLHKRKMAADRYRSFLILEPFVLTSIIFIVVPR